MQHEIDVIIARLSESRFVTYHNAVSSVEDGLNLYEWNLAASAEMFKMIAVVEVVLRNSVSEQIAAQHARRGVGTGWLFDERNFLNSYHRAAVVTAVQKLEARQVSVNVGTVIPELNFGFWRYLLTRRYFGHFGEALFMRAFPFLRHGELHELAKRVRRINELRNRIAHHEPIFERRLDLDYRDCLSVLGAVCPVTAEWARGISRLPEVLQIRPTLRTPSV